METVQLAVISAQQSGGNTYVESVKQLGAAPAFVR